MRELDESESAANEARLQKNDSVKTRSQHEIKLSGSFAIPDIILKEKLREQTNEPEGLRGSRFLWQFHCVSLKNIAFPGKNLISPLLPRRWFSRIVLAAFKLSSSASGARAEISLVQKCTISSFRPRPRIDRARLLEYRHTIIPPSVFSSSRLCKEDATRRDATGRERKGMSERQGSIRRRRPNAFAAPKS